jgi:hypothetical protein
VSVKHSRHIYVIRINEYVLILKGLTIRKKHKDFHCSRIIPGMTSEPKPLAMFAVVSKFVKLCTFSPDLAPISSIADELTLFLSAASADQSIFEEGSVLSISSVALDLTLLISS